jgi:hypothetical protein
LVVAAFAAFAGLAALVCCGNNFDKFEGTPEEVLPDGALGAGDGGATETSDGAAGSEGGASDVDGGINPPGAGAGGDTASIACGATTCAIPSSMCCVAALGSGKSSYTCETSATCARPPGGGHTAGLKCSGAENCPALTVCCIRESSGNAASECQTSCTFGAAQLCDPRAADAGCPAALRCSSDHISDWGDLPSGYATCGGRGT